jgi:hypothetical protein
LEEIAPGLNLIYSNRYSVPSNMTLFGLGLRVTNTTNETIKAIDKPEKTNNIKNSLLVATS